MSINFCWWIFINQFFSINFLGPSFDEYDDENEGSGDDLSDDYYGNYVDENTDYNTVDDNRPGVNFINILCTHFFVQRCFAQLFSSYILTLVKVRKHFCTKNVRVKRWWKWRHHFKRIYFIGKSFAQLLFACSLGL